MHWAHECVTTLPEADSRQLICRIAPRESKNHEWDTWFLFSNASMSTHWAIRRVKAITDTMTDKYWTKIGTQSVQVFKWLLFKLSVEHFFTSEISTIQEPKGRLWLFWNFDAWETEKQVGKWLFNIIFVLRKSRIYRSSIAVILMDYIEDYQTFQMLPQLR